MPLRAAWTAFKSKLQQKKSWGFTVGSCKTASSCQDVREGLVCLQAEIKIPCSPLCPSATYKTKLTLAESAAPEPSPALSSLFVAAVRDERSPSGLLPVPAFVSCLDGPSFILNKCNMVQTGYCVWGDWLFHTNRLWIQPFRESSVCWFISLGR